MAEVFPYPTVKEVAFEIRYPNLFSIENKISDFQERIITRFPESQQVFHRQMLFADIGPDGKLAGIPEPPGEGMSRKTWVFKSTQAYETRVTTNSLGIVSKHHKTYNNPASPERFREVIDFVVNNFLLTITLPIVKRIGLRYIDECPLPTKDNATLDRLYNSAFPIQRFPITNAEGMYFEVTTKRDNHNLFYREALAKEADRYKLVLDFDGFETDVTSADFLRVADELHEMIEREYFNIIKEPIKEYMRTGNLG